MLTEDWLNKLNKEFREAGIEQPRRPWVAIQRYSAEFNTSVDLTSGLAKKIFEWFAAHSKPGAHQIGNLYESVYFYDSAFWPVSIPIGYGTFKLNVLESLDQMPKHISTELWSDRKQAWDYSLFWADCVDYGFGLDDLTKDDTLNKFGMRLLLSGDQELRAAISILKQPRPDSRAILNCRMAVEIFLKAFIALKVGLTENQAVAIGHNLNKGFDKFIEVSGFTHWKPVRDRLSIFPEVRARYEPQEVPLNLLWEGFTIAQSLGVTSIREHTDRNTLEQILPPDYINRQRNKL